MLNGGDPDFMRCIATASSTDADFTYRFRCGERTLSKYIAGVQIFSVISVHPNPTTGLMEVQLDLQSEAVITIVVVDAMGRRISAETFTFRPGRCVGLLDVGGLESGSYFLEISDGNLRATSPFIKVR